MNRLVFFYQVVEGLVPALQCHDILTPIHGKPQIKTRRYTGLQVIKLEFILKLKIKRNDWNESHKSVGYGKYTTLNMVLFLQLIG